MEAAHSLISLQWRVPSLAIPSSDGRAQALAQLKKAIGPQPGNIGENDALRWSLANIS